MIWGWRHINDYPIHVPDNAQTVLIFNEPNFYKQANLSAADAARLWKTEIQPKLAGKTLVGPTAAPCSSSSKCYGDVDEWFLDFFKHCKHCQIDYIATHLYYCNADQTMAKLQHLWNLFRKPIWLTEFACPHSHSVSTQLAYMKDILPRLEAAHFVAKYSWYASRHRDNGFTTAEISLLHHDSSTLNTLGNYYNNFWRYALCVSHFTRKDGTNKQLLSYGICRLSDVKFFPKQLWDLCSFVYNIIFVKMLCIIWMLVVVELYFGYMVMGARFDRLLGKPFATMVFLRRI